MRRAPAAGLRAFAVLAVLASSAAAGDLSAGRRIFHRGVADGGMIATFGRSSIALPPAARRCAGCHGLDGAGGGEGGVAIPAIAASDLAAPRLSSPGQPGRPGYDDAALRRALTDGLDPAGRRIGGGMPRFRLTPAQATALIDYLHVLGTDRDVDPGLSSDEIRVGTVLPLSGPQAAWGGAMRAGIETALARAGEIYGRRLRLVAVDAGDDAAQSLRRLMESDQAFALVAPLTGSGGEVAEAMEDLPIIGPLAPTPAQPEINRFYLLPRIEDQMRVLVDDIVGARAAPLRLAVIGQAGGVADAAAEQAARAGAVVMRCATVDDLTAIEPVPDAVMALPGVDLADLLARLPPRFAAVTIVASAEALALGDAHDERLRLVLPVLPADPRGHDISANVPPFAAAAAAVLIEGVKRMGARASRAGLIAAIETLTGFPTGVLPPLSFSRGQHAGNRASVVIRPDRARGLIVLGDWRSPR